jgi:hypothetical protein
MYKNRLNKIRDFVSVTDNTYLKNELEILNDEIEAKMLILKNKSRCQQFFLLILKKFDTIQ